VLDLIILSLALMLHMWALPYTFKNILIDSIVRVVQLAFGIIILVHMNATAFDPSAVGLTAGGGVGLACLVFQLFWNRGNDPTRTRLSARLLASQSVILLFQVPTEEIFYRGVFFASLTVIWGAPTALIISTALSTMVTVVSSRKQLYWIGSGIMGVLCCLGYYWTQSIWAPVLIHVLNDVGFIALNEKRDIFDS